MVAPRRHWVVLHSAIDRLGHTDGVVVFADVVDAVEGDSGVAGEGGDGDGGGESVRDGTVAESFGDDAFSGDAEEDGSPSWGEGGDIFEEREVVIIGFSEPNAWIEDDSLGCDADGLAGGELVNKEGADFVEHVGVARRVLHGLGCALHVHENDTNVGTCAELDHLWVEGESTDVVDNVGTCINGGFGDGGFAGVDRKCDVGRKRVLECCDDRCCAGDLFVNGNFCGTRSSGLAADVDDARTFGDHFLSFANGALDGGEFSTVGKRVRRDIEYAHDLALDGEIKGAVG